MKISFQALVAKLQAFWEKQGCLVLQPYDMPVGAATFHPATFLRSIGPEPWFSVYAQLCRRPGDGRYGDHPNRLQQYCQLQVILKPPPANVQDLYLESLQHVGLDMQENDVRFVEDNWESPTLGASGLGWEVWLNGMEVSQFTYFQQCGGLECNPPTAEITYGLERLAMYLQDVDSVFDLLWGEQQGQAITYGDILHQNEKEQSAFNFDSADVEVLRTCFEASETMCLEMLEARLPLPAHEQVMMASHYFNLLDARHAISVDERENYVLKIRKLAQRTAKLHYEIREALGFPLLKESA